MDGGSRLTVRSRSWKRSGLPGWCALAEPIVRSISFRLARRFWLQPADRQDLEQELWLELLVRHGGRDRVNDFHSMGGQDAQRHREAIASQLHREVERIAAALVRCWPFWRRLRPAPERQMSDAVREGLTACCGDVARHHLALDVSALLPELPDADRRFCQSLMNGVSVSALNSSDDARRMVALRADFTALDLHDYL